MLCGSMSTSIRKTKAKILTFSHTTDTTSPLTFEVVGDSVTVRVMTAEDGPASRRVKVNTSAASVVGIGRAIIKVTCAGLNHDEQIDIAAAPPVVASFTLVNVSDEVDPDPVI